MARRRRTAAAAAAGAPSPSRCAPRSRTPTGTASGRTASSPGTFSEDTHSLSLGLVDTRQSPPSHHITPSLCNCSTSQTVVLSHRSHSSSSRRVVCSMSVSQASHPIAAAAAATHGSRRKYVGLTDGHAWSVRPRPSLPPADPTQPPPRLFPASHAAAWRCTCPSLPFFPPPPKSESAQHCPLKMPPPPMPPPPPPSASGLPYITAAAVVAGSILYELSPPRPLPPPSSERATTSSLTRRRRMPR